MEGMRVFHGRRGGGYLRCYAEEHGIHEGSRSSTNERNTTLHAAPSDHFFRNTVHTCAPGH
eukprot:7108348-Pyramimonas_sp.AAC.1